VVHWGAALGAQSKEDLRALSTADVEPREGNVVDEPVRLAILPEHHAGWQGRPGVAGHRDGADWSPRFQVTGLDIRPGATVDDGLVDAGPGAIVFHARDEVAMLDLDLEIELLASGLLRARAHLTNRGDTAYTVSDLSGRSST
jgi:alpha-galactosidase